MSDFIPEDEFDDYDHWSDEFRNKVQERLEAHGVVEGVDPFDALINVLADMHIAVQQAYVIIRTLRDELEKIGE